MSIFGRYFGRFFGRYFGPIEPRVPAKSIRSVRAVISHAEVSTRVVSVNVTVTAR